MNTVDALKDLYKTLCGKDYAGDPNPTDAEMISAIAKDASSGGGGGDGDLVFPVELDDSDPENMTLITPFEDVLAAVRAGKKLGFLDPSTGEMNLEQFNTFYVDDNVYLMSTSIFFSQTISGTTVIIAEQRISSDGVISYSQVQFTPAG